MIRLAYNEWMKGTDIYTNTLLFFEDFGGQQNTTISQNPKQFTVFERIFDKIKKRLFIIYPKFDYIEAKRGRIIYYEHITDILQARNGIIILDEAQTLLNSRNWESLPDEFSYKLQQHRKHRLDLYCTTQNMGTVEINYRRLVQHWIHYSAVFEIKKPRSNKVLFGLYTKEFKDIDYLYEKNTEEIDVPTIKRYFFTIHFRKKRLYDTMFDIGFTRFKLIWVTTKDLKTKKSYMKMFLIPKKYTLTDALRQSVKLSSLSTQKTQKPGNRK